MLFIPSSLFQKGKLLTMSIADDLDEFGYEFVFRQRPPSGSEFAFQQSPPSEDYCDTFKGSKFATEEEKYLLEQCHYDKINRGASDKEQYLEFFGRYADVKRSWNVSNASGDVVLFDIMDLSEMSLKLLKAVEIRKEKLSEGSCVHLENQRRDQRIYHWMEDEVDESDTDSNSNSNEESPEDCEKCFETAANVEKVVGGEQKMLELKEDIKSIRASVMYWMRESLQAVFPDDLPRLSEEVLNMILEFTNLRNPVQFPFFDRRKAHWKFVNYDADTKYLLRELYSQMTELYLIVKEILFDYSGYTRDVSGFGEIWGTVKMKGEELKDGYIRKIVEQSEEDMSQGEGEREGSTQDARTEDI